MRIPVNLASEPFRRDRPMIVASSGVAALLVVMLAVLVYLAIGERDRAAEARETLARMQRQMQTIEREEAKLQGVIREPRNAEVLERSQFLNSLIMRKGVSWTKIFADLEKVTPHNVRLMSIRPQISARNELVLDMWVGAQATEPIQNFMMQLEQASSFGATTVHNGLPPSQNEPLYRYRISVNYAQKL
jgi:type IV pilus assembly protein PilN